MSIRRRLLALATASLLTTVITLTVGEVALRLWFPATLAPVGLEDLGGVMVLRPHLRGRHAVPQAFDVRITTNSQRFRGPREYAPFPAKDTLRIVALGDSFTFGAGAEDDQTYPAELERVGNARPRPPFSRVEVINAGVPGTGTGEQALFYDGWVRPFRPHVVILQMYANDQDDDRQRRPFTTTDAGVVPRAAVDLVTANSAVRRLSESLYAVPGYTFLAQNSHLVSFLRLTVSRSLRRARAREEAHHLVDPRERAAQFRESAVLTEGELTWLEARVRADGGRILVVFIPERDTVYELLVSPETREKAQAMVKHLTASCAALNLAFMDLTPLLAAARSRGEDPYYARDLHLTPHGYRLVAHAVAGMLDEHKAW